MTRRIFLTPETILVRQDGKLTTDGFKAFRQILDTLEAYTVPLILPEYTVAGVPSAASWDNGVIIVSDEAGGRTLATSDGTNWRRVSDGAVIS